MRNCDIYVKMVRNRSEFIHQQNNKEEEEEEAVEKRIAKDIVVWCHASCIVHRVCWIHCDFVWWLSANIILDRTDKGTFSFSDLWTVSIWISFSKLVHSLNKWGNFFPIFELQINERQPFNEYIFNERTDYKRQTQKSGNRFNNIS